MANISHIGFGCGRLRGGLEASNSYRLIETALSHQVKHFDVAPMYGEGDAEKLLGNALKGGSRQVTIYTKYGIEPRERSFYSKNIRPVIRHVVKGALSTLPGKKRATANSAPPTVYGHFDVNEIVKSIERSLKLLNVDNLDGLLLHEPRLDDPQPKMIDKLLSLQKDNLIKKLGVGTGAGFTQLPQFGLIRQAALLDGLPLKDHSKETWVHGIIRYAAQLNIGKVTQQLFQELNVKPEKNDVLFNACIFAAVMIDTNHINGLIYSTTNKQNLLDFIVNYNEATHVVSSLPAEQLQYAENLLLKNLVAN